MEWDLKSAVVTILYVFVFSLAIIVFSLFDYAEAGVTRATRSCTRSMATVRHQIKIVVRQGRAARSSGFASPTHYAVYILIIQPTPPIQIRRWERVCLHRLGESLCA